ncbi:hypothetical protein LSM04_002645 [Trypanosoma melophagium]|uniref:uncharacterized protein n=1 Tax=Trypanosoma melophagium TaxID=715481 RepID=UPI003519F1D4|nr:hypothetical protein LSM04_002645 [Trypanosoma melophagium]
MRPSQTSPPSATPADVGAGVQEEQQQGQEQQQRRSQRRLLGSVPISRNFSTMRSSNILVNRQLVSLSSNIANTQSCYYGTRGEMHNRPRLVAKTVPLILSAPVLDRPKWLNSFFDPCFCLRGNYSEIWGVGIYDESENIGERRTNAVLSSPQDSQCTASLGHFLWRFFCLRCSVAEQTRLLFAEEEKRGHTPYRFCCEGFFGSEGKMPRTFWTMCLCDLLTVGCPFACCYHGLGTTLYGCRLRYLIRCRYRLNGTVAGDFFTMLCCPLLAVDQQGLEMMQHGLYECRHVSRIMM